MQKKTNYFLFIVQGRGFHQRLELDFSGVVPRSVVENTKGNISNTKREKV